MATEESTLASRLPISAFIICQDEEATLGNCIESLRGFPDIVIVDSGSTDGTLDLVRSYIERGWPIRLLSETWRGYAGQKQFALDQCREEWCFNIDSDERVDDALRAALPQMLAADASIVGWRIARRPYLIGYGYTPAHVYERRNLRIIRRGKGAYDLAQKVHEGIRPDGQVADAAKGSILHFRNLVIDQQILKENKYSSLKADQKVSEGVPASRLKLVFNPLLYFLRLYFRNGLWRCGTSGFIEAATAAVYSFLTEAKIHQRHALRAMPQVDDMDGSPLARKTQERE